MIVPSKHLGEERSRSRWNIGLAWTTHSQSYNGWLESRQIYHNRTGVRELVLLRNRQELGLVHDGCHAPGQCRRIELGLLTVTISTNIHCLRPPQCPSRDLNCKSATAVQSTVLTIGLSMAGIAFGALIPPVTVFGADQFDENESVERKQRS
ncbi:hypothetical protein Mapa_017522 [Marchantia paleacea]|nr:hypothetical protein Mapa_017522 [Marchantia paleacea]